MSVEWKIWKHHLPTETQEFELDLPSRVPLTIQVQDGLPVMWSVCLVHKDTPDIRTRKFVWVMTGEKVPASVRSVPPSYLGTVQILHGLVLHLFEVHP